MGSRNLLIIIPVSRGCASIIISPIEGNRGILTTLRNSGLVWIS